MDKSLLRTTEERGNAKTKAPLFHISFFFMLNQDKRRNKEDNMHIRTRMHGESYLVGS
ncbi:MAG: hypothetical protein U9N41_00320 [Euryarchaeota archaeon]|nr:hypothetical protein [Euryarchaeota archaeon]